MKTTIAIDVIYTKYIEVEVPDIKGTEDWAIIEKAAEAEFKQIPDEINGFYYNWNNIEEV